MPNPSDNTASDAIHAYGRNQAIEDGFLREVPEDLRQQAGFRHPLALTLDAWADCVAWTDEDKRRKPQALQDETGRLWGVLLCARAAIRATSASSDSAAFTVYRVPPADQGDALEALPVVLHAVRHGDDSGEPVITIMLPGED